MKKLSAKEVIERTIDHARKRNTVTVYAPIVKNIYHDGYSYRVRVTKDYNRTSVNFHKMKDALKFRNKLKKD